jgi:hypothetical protein
LSFALTGEVSQRRLRVWQLCPYESWELDGSLTDLEVATQPVTLNLSGQLDIKELMNYFAQSLHFNIIFGI